MGPPFTATSATGGVTSAATRAMDAVGRCDVLVDNAGVARLSRLEDVSPGDWEATVRVNLTGLCSARRSSAATCSIGARAQ